MIGFLASVNYPGNSNKILRLRTIKGAHLLNNNERVRWVSVRSDNSGFPEANKPPSARPLAVDLVWEIYEPLQ